jgi:tetratricopeptide (TPR) repeat protein
MTSTTSPTASQAPSPASDLERLLGYLQLDPDNEPLRADVFDRALALGKFSVAQEQTTWNLSRSPLDPTWRHRAAVLAMAQACWAEAEPLLRGLIDEGQTDPVLAFNLAYVHFAQGRHETAIALLKPVVDAHAAALPQAMTLLLRCLHAGKAIAEGIDLFSTHAAYLRLPEAFGVASLLALDGGRLDLADSWSKAALEQDPQLPEALVTQASLSLSQRDVQGALARLDLALQRHPDDGRTWSAVGLARMLAVDLDGAQRAFRKALLGIPNHIGTWHGLGWCELFRKDLPAARAVFEQALALDRNFGESHGALAVVLALQNQVPEAEASVRRALRLDPRGLSARYAQAILSGEVRDAAGFAHIAQAALAQHRDASGRSLAEVVMGQGKA